MKATFPHMGNLYITVKVLLDELGLEYVIPPFNNKKALEIGTRYAPELACIPLKINLGNFIQAAENGADTVLMVGGCGPCRFGYYCEMQREILKDLGYNMDVIVLEPPNGNISEFVDRIYKLTGKINWLNIINCVRKAVYATQQADDLEKAVFRVRPIEVKKGQTDTVYKQFHTDILQAHGTKQVLEIIKKYKEQILAIQTVSGHKPMKVGIVGEIYTIIDAFTNQYIEEKLGSMGIEVERSLMLGDWIDQHLIKQLLHLKYDRQYKNAAKPFLSCMIGGHAQETIGNTVLYANRGFDGVIQLMPLSCMPEIVAESILPTVEKEFKIPVLTLIIDEMTGETGYMTRIEAFADLMERRRTISVLS